MGEFIHANGHGKTWTFAIEDVFSETNLAIAIISGLVGYLVFEYLRKKLQCKSSLVSILHAIRIKNIRQDNNPDQVVNVRAAHDRKQIQFRPAHSFERHVKRMVRVDVRKITGAE